MLRAGSDRHFKLDLKVNGTPITFILDTGASDIVLSQDDAARVGLDPDSLPYLGQARTANGTVGLARVELAEVVLAEGGLEFRDLNVPAFVNEGELDVSLLGMGYLSRYARIAIEGRAADLAAIAGFGPFGYGPACKIPACKTLVCTGLRR